MIESLVVLLAVFVVALGALLFREYRHRVANMKLAAYWWNRFRLSQRKG